MERNKKYEGKVIKISKGLIELLINDEKKFFTIKDRGFLSEVNVNDFIEIEVNKKLEIISMKILKKTKTIDETKERRNKREKKEKENEKFNSINFFFPEYLKKIYNNDKLNIDNYNLYLNKFIIGKSDKDRLKIKIENLENIDFSKVRFNLIKNFTEKYFSSIKTLHHDTYLIKEITFTPDYKLIIGLGNPSIYEISITLHHIYGIPYIPAQAIKGVLRNYVINKYFDLPEDKRNKLEDYKNIAQEKEKEALKSPLFKFIFGSENEKGKLIFFDAFPINKVNIEMDIMNNHFPDYYEGKSPPADYQNPRPIKFLVVKDTKFKFFVGLRKNLKLNTFEKFGNEGKITNENKLLKYVIKLLKEALEFNGIGAKTSIGYGYGNIEETNANST